MLIRSQILASIIASGFAVTPIMAANLDFKIFGISSNEGKLYVQLFQGEENYKNGEAMLVTMVKPTSDKAVVRFNEVQPGEYALRFFHDENNNGKLETNLFGLPTEGYGFSNNAKPNFGPVSYAEIKFSVEESDALITNETSVIY